MSPSLPSPYMSSSFAPRSLRRAVLPLLLSAGLLTACERGSTEPAPTPQPAQPGLTPRRPDVPHVGTDPWVARLSTTCPNRCATVLDIPLVQARVRAVNENAEVTGTFGDETREPAQAFVWSAAKGV